AAGRRSACSRTPRAGSATSRASPRAAPRCGATSASRTARRCSRRSTATVAASSACARCSSAATRRAWKRCSQARATRATAGSGTGNDVKHLDLDPIRRAAGIVALPGSKSISNRVLLLAALSEGDTRIRDLLDADDTRVMLDALERLGVRIGNDTVHGVGGAFPVKSADLNLGNAGTAFRPLTAVLAF